jgi:hypothetical protein
MQDFSALLQKYESRLSGVNHVDGKQLALNYLFPLLRKLAGSVGEILSDHEEAINDLEDALENDGETLAQARDVILLLSGLLDETMVAAGFYSVTDKGLEDTGKAPTELRERFVEAAAQVVAVVQNIEEELNGADDEDEIEPDSAEGKEPASESAGGRSGAVAANAAAGASAATTAVEPDDVIEGDGKKSGAAAVAADAGKAGGADAA